MMFYGLSRAKILYGGQVKLEKLIRTDINQVGRKEVKYTFNTKIILLVGKWREPSLFSADSGIVKKRNVVTFKEVRTSVWNVLKFYKKFRIVEASMVFEQYIVPRRVFKVPLRIYYNDAPILTYKLSLVDLKKSGYEDIINAKPLIQVKIDKYSGKAMNQTYEKEFKVINNPSVTIITRTGKDVAGKIEVSDIPNNGITSPDYLPTSQSFKAVRCEAPLYEESDLESDELSSSLPEALVQIDQIDRTLSDINKEVTEKKLDNLAKVAAVEDLYESDILNPVLVRSTVSPSYLTAKTRLISKDPLIYTENHRPVIPLESSSLKNGDILNRFYKSKRLPLSTKTDQKVVINKGPLDRKNYFKRLVAFK